MQHPQHPQQQQPQGSQRCGSIKFGQPASTKVIPEVFVGDVERSPEAKEIMQLVTQHTLTAAEHSGRAVVLYSESLVKGIRQATRAAIEQARAQARAAEKRERSMRPSCLSSCFACLCGETREVDMETMSHR